MIGSKGRQVPSLIRVWTAGVVAAAVAGVFTGVSVTVHSQTAPSAETATIEVTLKGFRSDQGQAMVALFVNDRGWPEAGPDAFGGFELPIRNRIAVARFEKVPAGLFAVSAFHDRDRDKTLDRGMFGRPTEDYGFSANARGRFGPPSFEAARLEAPAGGILRIEITVK